MEQEQLQVKTPEYVSLQFKLAGLGSRTAAYLIDYAILMVSQIILTFILFFSLSFDAGAFYFDQNTLFITLYLIAIFVLNLGYFALLEFFWRGKTIGKKLLGIRVIQENGHNVTFLSSLIRNFIRLLDVYVIGMVLIFAHPKHKRLGDLAAGTLVIHEQGKNSSKKNTVEQYIEKRGLHKEDLTLESFDIQQFNQRDWQLLNTYVHRIITIQQKEKPILTEQVSEILLPKIDTRINQYSLSNESILLLLYLHLKDEWEY
ncbi:RDD family protein [Gracilibacillus phocaeensis]|uniref:RDD family protein n=1 Tax=Gracilibacillus phocaeensis TaxID=2042304 RepID=UPI00102F45A1|nr:RDD family protein [Gracilibacillus phocaeensis]